MAFKFAKNPKKMKKSKVPMTKHFYSFFNELTPKEEEFFDLVEKCDLPAIEKFLITNRVNINMKNYQGITPLHLAIQNDCEPLVEMFLQHSGIRIGDSVLFAIAHDNLELLERLLQYQENVAVRGAAQNADGYYQPFDTDVVSDDSDEFPSWMTPLQLAAQCGRYETVQYLLDRGHQLDRPHTPWCRCVERCTNATVMATLDVVADGCRRMNEYKAISNPTYVCCTSPADPILECFRLHKELLECGNVDQVYKTAYAAMAQQVREFGVELIVNCRTSDEVKVMLRNRDGCEFRGQFPYPRLITAMDYKQKEFVAHTNVQQVLETAWIGDWVDWKAYSTARKCAYPVWRLLTLPWTVLLGVLMPDSELNRRNRLPINRMFNGLVTYVMFLALLFVQSNADKYQTARGAPDPLSWAPVVVFVAGHALEKCKLWALQGSARYFRDPWNGFDTLMLTLFVAAYMLWAVAELQHRFRDSDDAADRQYWHWADPQLLAEGLFAVATVMAYMRLLFLCQLNYYIGPMQVSLGKVLNDFGKFFTFLAIIMIAFTSGLGTLYAYYAGMVYKDPETNKETWQEPSFVSVPDTFRTLFWGIFCMTSLEATNVVVSNGPSGGPDPESHYLTQLTGYGLFAVFEVLMVIVMLNMLIAAMSDTFQRVDDNAENEWLFGRTKVYVNYMLLDDLPPPFNLLLTIGHIKSAGSRLKSKLSSYNLVDDADVPLDLSEYRMLTAELMKRYFTHKAQAD